MYHPVSVTRDLLVWFVLVGTRPELFATVGVRTTAVIP